MLILFKIVNSSIYFLKLNIYIIILFVRVFGIKVKSDWSIYNIFCIKKFFIIFRKNIVLK